MRRAAVGLALLLLGVACKRAGDAAEPSDAGASRADASSPTLAASGAPPVVAETVPRCRAEGAAVPLPGDDVVVGDAAVADGALYLGVARRDAGKRVASVARVALDLSAVKMIDVGPALGDDPPPSPRVDHGAAHALWYARPSTGAAGPQPMRELRLARVDGPALGPATVAAAQQADESYAYDVAWPLDKGAPVVAWDEDAPRKAGALLADRGVVKVQLASGAADAGAAAARIASPETSDAEDPHLAARPGGGFFLAWLAKKPEVVDAGDLAEGPGERRAFRWVELVALDAKGEPQGAPRRLTPERGRVASFDLVVPKDGKAEVVAVVVDEAAHAEGTGARLVRVALEGDRVDAVELAGGSVAHGAAEVLATTADAPSRWLAWTDATERTVLAPVTRALDASGPPIAEPALDGARPLAAASGAVLAVAPVAGTTAGARPADRAAPGGRVELRRFVCR